MSENIPKCKTCGSVLFLDLNGDYFCMKSVIIEEKHDDCYPSPFIQVKRDDLQELYNFIVNTTLGYDYNAPILILIRRIKEVYGIE